ncbi:hypothetical protein RND81_12G193100 [Saponaria officinalis]|uniref:Jacalin-type lectin domain-containing protein n=1 Tax=Saponaria officinalis TaxID=3572 RepID=A0AAW1HCU2_SAPOF
MAQASPKAQNVVEYGPYGSQAKPNFDIIFDNTDRIKTLRIGNGFVVDGIGFDIIDQTGATKTVYFGGYGHEFHTINFKDDERITKITGFEGDYADMGGRRHIAQIKIYTTWRKEGYGPFGWLYNCTNVKAFDTGVPKEGPFVGFFGVTGNFLEGLGAYVLKVRLLLYFTTI